MSPEEFAGVAKWAGECGSQMNYLVDSAGGMLPDQIRTYFESIANATSIPCGFHGHDNICMAIANSLAAAECGARWIDTTLFGVGRGSGNAATELMVALLNRLYGACAGIDGNRLIHLAETQAAPLTYYRHQETLSMSLGLAQVHSMYLERIVDAANREGLDPHDLIAQVGAIDQLNASAETLRAAADVVKKGPRRQPNSSGGFFALTPTEDIAAAIANAENVAEKLGLPCNIFVEQAEGAPSVEVVREAAAIEVHFRGDASMAAKTVERPVTRVILDASQGALAPMLRELCKQPVVVTSDRNGSAESRTAISAR